MSIEDVNPDDVASSQSSVTLSNTEIIEELAAIENRVDSLERLIMVIIDKLELDYPGISL